MSPTVPQSIPTAPGERDTYSGWAGTDLLRRSTRRPP